MHNDILLKHPAHLLIGDADLLKTSLMHRLQKIFCSKHGCLECFRCTQIMQEQYPDVIWIIPETSYNLEMIDEILEQVRFKLDAHQHKYFIFTQAEQLTPACSNRLLKTIEEPHEGYHFIFLASRTDTILPTIISRCLIQEFNHQAQNTKYQEIIDIFTQNNFKNPQQFLKIVDKLQLDSQGSKDIIDYLFSYFYNNLKITMHTNHADQNSLIIQKTMDKLLILKKEISQLPPAGATKLFWKNVFMKFHLLEN